MPRVAISAPIGPVYQAVATPEGISQWWTGDGVRDESAQGPQPQFRWRYPSEFMAYCGARLA
jgi:uncharacterized protein YndB with AHSA1/START domain